jgi:hypothetical protein
MDNKLIKREVYLAEDEDIIIVKKKTKRSVLKKM